MTSLLVYLFELFLLATHLLSHVGVGVGVADGMKSLTYVTLEQV
jgi:hypothetical protein